MKNLTKALPAIALATLMLAGTAAASDDITISDVNTSVGTASVFLEVDDGVATLVGDVDTFNDKTRLENDVMKVEGIDEVVNHLIYSSSGQSGNLGNLSGQTIAR